MAILQDRVRVAVTLAVAVFCGFGSGMDALAAPPDVSSITVVPRAAAPAAPVAVDQGVIAGSESLGQTLIGGGAKAASRAHRAPGRPVALDTQRSRALLGLRDRAEGVELRMRGSHGTPRSLRGDGLERGRLGRAAATARRFLRRNKALLGLRDPDRELEIKSENRDAGGGLHIRFRQRHGDLEVWPADVIVHVDPSGDVIGMTGQYTSTPLRVEREPTVLEAEAIAIARVAVGAGPDAEVYPHGAIVHLSDAGAPRLAWKMEIVVAFDEQWVIAIDAGTGSVLRRTSRIMTDGPVVGSGLDLLGINRSLDLYEFTDPNFGVLYENVDTSKDMFDVGLTDPPFWPSPNAGVIHVIDALGTPLTAQGGFPPLFEVVRSATTLWAPADSVSGAFGLSEVYDYYFLTYGRSSFDGNGSSLLGIVRIDFDNAFWHGGLNAMAFGDDRPYAGALDVVGHEVTHGVIQETANLLYQNQSGALNESLADIFGEMVENRTEGDNDWLLGTDLGVIIRNMMTPGALEFAPGQPYPSTMSEFIPNSNPIAAADNGGVHLNSSIVNRAYYLAAEGLPNAVGKATAEQIFFDALENRLTANATFLDARLAAIAAADALFGAATAGVIGEAFDAVEIFDGGTVTEPPDTPPVAGPDSEMFLRFDVATSRLAVARREAALGDPAAGIFVPDNITPAFVPSPRQRPSVTGDGSRVWYVDLDFAQDPCSVDTNATGGTIAFDCIGAGSVGGAASVAVSRDGTRVAFTPEVGGIGIPLNSIVVADVSVPSPFPIEVFTLDAPALDGGSIGTILFADAMEFTAAGDIVFDALNSVTLPSGSTFEAWSIYFLDRATSQLTAIVPPLISVDTGFPSVAKTNDAFITFDLTDPFTGDSTAVAANLVTGATVSVGSILAATTIPSYNGDDTAIRLTQVAGCTIVPCVMSQPVAADRITPTGVLTVVLENADAIATYRRGPYVPPAADSDLDGVPDTTDNCPNEPNPGQEDFGQLGGPGSDLIGDACQCGDNDDDGEITVDDVTAQRNSLVGSGSLALQKCSVTGALECDLVDLVVLRRNLNSQGPAIAQVCSAAAI